MSTNPMNDVLSIVISVFAVLASLYASVRSWLTQRKFQQIEKERLIPKLIVECKSDKVDNKLMKIRIEITNKVETNVKLVKFSIDGRQRTNEYQRSFELGQNLSSEFKSIDSVTKFNITGFNNAKLLSLQNSSPYCAFRLFMPDTIYERPVKDTIRADKKIMDISNIKENIHIWTEEKISTLKSLIKEDKKILEDFLFIDTVNRELRGLQLFSEQTIAQEIIVKYEGQGILYLNVELSSIRQTMKNIETIEQYKSLCNDIIKDQKISLKEEQQYKKLLYKIVKPEANEIHKQKSTFLVYLS